MFNFLVLLKGGPLFPSQIIFSLSQIFLFLIKKSFPTTLFSYHHVLQECQKIEKYRSACFKFMEN